MPATVTYFHNDGHGNFTGRFRAGKAHKTMIGNLADLDVVRAGDVAGKSISVFEVEERFGAR